MTQAAWLILAGCALAINLVLFIVMGIDKLRANRKKRRIPESTLFFLAFIGGAAGGLLGMKAFGHKTQKCSFRIGFPLLLIWNIAACAAIIYLLYRLAS